MIKLFSILGFLLFIKSQTNDNVFAAEGNYYQPLFGSIQGDCGSVIAQWAGQVNQFSTGDLYYPSDYATFNSDELKEILKALKEFTKQLEQTLEASFVSNKSQIFSQYKAFERSIDNEDQKKALQKTTKDIEKLAEDFAKECGAAFKDKEKAHEAFLDLTFKDCAKDTNCQPLGP